MTTISSTPIRMREGAQAARMQHWHGSPTIAHLLSEPHSRFWSKKFLAGCLDNAAQHGYQKVISGALNEIESNPFVQLGFHSVDYLVLFRRDLAKIPFRYRNSNWRLQSLSENYRTSLLRLDNECFDQFWALDQLGLHDATTATNRSRTRLLIVDDNVAGYAITGRANRQGYLQRLGVSSQLRRQGIGHALVYDSLSWLRRWGAKTATLNTQIENIAAQALYESLGFSRLEERLTVWERELS